MHLLLVGISHRTAPVELRERVDFQARGVDDALRALAGARHRRAKRSSSRPATAPSSTSPATKPTRRAQDLVALRQRVPRRRPADARAARLRRHATSTSARHLFRVAAGLDSLVVGEPQILGQVKDAHTVAADAQTSGPVLNRLFHSSFARRQARAHRRPASARARCRSATPRSRWRARSSATSSGRSVARHRRRRDGQAHRAAHEVAGRAAASRSSAGRWRTRRGRRKRSAAPARRRGTSSTPSLGASDIVITATGAAAPILTKAHIEAVMRPRRNRPLFIIDIAMPRDVEAAAGEIEQVFLYNIDDLQATVRENLARRASEVARAEAHRRRGSREVRRLAPLARRDPDRRRAAAAVREHPARRARAARLQAVDAAARGARARRRDHAPDRREAAAEADRAAEDAGDADMVAQYTYSLSRLFGLSMGAGEESAHADGFDKKPD